MQSPRRLPFSEAPSCKTLDVIELRPATADDVDFMWHMLYYASYTDREDGVTLDDMKSNPDLIRHLDDWGNRTGDIALIAVDKTGRESRLVGASWLRHMIGHEQQDVTFVDEHTPELVISVVPEIIGRGAGSRLMSEILHIADGYGIRQVVLSARASNPAVTLYERHGFEIIERITNRVGTESVKMLRVTPSPQ